MSNLDLERLKKELDDIRRQETSGFWVPKEGKTLIRILPAVGEDAGTFYRKIGMHYRLYGGGAEICPRLTFGLKCPVCEVADKLATMGEVGRSIAADFVPTQRWLMNILNLDENKNKILHFLAPKTVMKQLLSFVLDPDWGDFTDLKHGRNAVLEKIVPSGDKLRTEYNVTLKPVQTPVDWIKLEDIPSFTDIIEAKVKSYDDLVKLVYGDGGSDMDMEEFIEFYELQKKAKQERKQAPSGEKEPERKEAKPPITDDIDDDTLAKLKAILSK